MNAVPPPELAQAERLQALKDGMACVSAGVVIVTAHHDGHDWGMTCSSFTTVSLDPALVGRKRREDGARTSMARAASAIGCCRY